MKRIKGAFSLALCFVILLSAVSFSAFAAENSSVTVKSAQNLFKPFSRSVRQGDTFDVVIYLQSDIKIIDGTVEAAFDNDCLKVTKCDSGKISSVSNISDEKQRADSSVITVFTAGEGFYDFTSKGRLLVYSFEVTEQPSGNCEITVDFKNLMANSTAINEEGKEDITVGGDKYLISKSAVKADGFAVSAEFSPLKGDVNLDGVVNINDATELQLALLNGKKLSYEQLTAAEVYYDGKISIRDVTVIQLFLAEIIEYM